MKRKIFSSAIVLTLVTQTLFGSLSYASTDKIPASTGTEKAQRYLVTLKKQANADQFAVKKGMLSKVNKKIKHTNAMVMSLKASEAQELMQDPDIAYVEDDVQVQAASVGKVNKDNGFVTNMKQDDQTVPWGIQDIGGKLALDEKEEGKGIDIAIFDTGIAEHPDLKVVGGVSFVEGVTSYADDNGHGTHVAGTVAALNNQQGVVGAAPKANLYAVKVLDKYGSGDYAQVIAGIDWAIDNKMNIISMSFGAMADRQALHDSIKKATEAGILFVAAAGNNGDGRTTGETIKGVQETELYPARYPEVVSVGAVNRDYKRAGYSSTGEELDLMAPGTDILSTLKDQTYGTMSGTSMATPHVTGAAAALWARNKKWNAQEVKQKLYEAATPLGDAKEYGHGFVNLAKALGLTDKALIMPTKDNPIPSEPSTPSGESFDLQKHESEVAGLEKAFLILKDRAKRQDKIDLMKQSNIAYHELAIAENELHRLPENLAGFNKQDATSVQAQQDVANYYSSSQAEFDKLKNTYSDKLVELSIQVPNDKLTQANSGDLNILSYSKTGDGQTVQAGNVARVSLMLSEPKPSGIRISVYNINNPSATVYSSSIASAAANTTINFAWSIPSSQTAGTYSIHFSYPDNGTSQYDDYFTVNVTSAPSSGGGGSTPTTPDTFEPNNTIAQAYVVSSGSSYTSYISSGSDQDHYRLTAGVAGMVTVTLAVPSGQDYDLTVTDANGYTIGSSTQGTGSAENVSWYATANTVYDLVVAGYLGSSGSSPYTLSIGSIQPSVPPTPTGLVPTSTDTTITLTWNAVSGATSYKVFLNGSQVTTTTATSYTFSNLTANSTYTVGVAGVNNNGTGLTASVNGTTKVATVQSLQLSIPVNVNLPVGKSALYSFKPTGTGKYRFFTGPYQTTGANNDTVLELYSDAGFSTTLTSNDDSNGTNFSQIDWDLIAGTTYYLKLRPYSISTGALYTSLTVVGAPPAPSAIGLNVPADINVPAPGVKVYSFTPATSGVYKMDTTYYGGNTASSTTRLDTTLALYTDSNLTKVVAFNDDAPGVGFFSSISYNMAAGTTYYVKVSNNFDYTLYTRLTVTQYVPTYIDMVKNTGMDVSTAANTPGYYKFTPAQAGLYRFFTSPYQGTGGNMDTVLHLYTDAAMGTEVATNDDCNSPYGTGYSKLEYALTANKTYYVKVNAKSSTVALQTQLRVEDDFDTSRGTAQLASWDTIGSDMVTSKFDVDYYKLPALNSLASIHLNITANQVVLEDSNGVVQATFLPGDNTVFKPQSTTAIYYAKVTYRQTTATGGTTMPGGTSPGGTTSGGGLGGGGGSMTPNDPVDPRNSATAVESLPGGSIEYSYSYKEATQNFDTFAASPGDPKNLVIKFRYLSSHATTRVEIYNSAGKLVHNSSPTELQNLSPGDHSFTWYGRLNAPDYYDPQSQTNRSSGAYYAADNTYFAIDGTYTIRLVAADAEQYPTIIQVTIQNLKPVILIPGIGGSRLYKGSDLIWMGVPDALLMPDTVNQLKLPAQDSYGEDEIPSAVKTGPTGDTTGLLGVGKLMDNNLYENESAIQFDPMIANLKNAGYREGVSLFGLPYDWRQDIRTQTHLLGERITQAIGSSGTTSVNLVAHSMGGLLAKDYLMCHENDNRIHNFISIGSPFLGAPLASKALGFEGYDFGILTMSELLGKKLATNLPSVYQLAPGEKYNTTMLENTGLSTYRYSEDFSKYPTVNEPLSKLTDLYPNQQLVGLANDRHNFWDQDKSPIRGVNMYQIVGDTQNTLSSIDFYAVYGKEKWHPEYTFTAGDGTVPSFSSEYATTTATQRYWAKTAGHSKMPREDATIQMVMNLLKDQPYLQPDGISIERHNKRPFDPLLAYSMTLDPIYRKNMVIDISVEGGSSPKTIRFDQYGLLDQASLPEDVLVQTMNLPDGMTNIQFFLPKSTIADVHVVTIEDVNINLIMYTTDVTGPHSSVEYGDFLLKSNLGLQIKATSDGSSVQIL